MKATKLILELQAALKANNNKDFDVCMKITQSTDLFGNARPEDEDDFDYHDIVDTNPHVSLGGGNFILLNYMENRE